MPPKCEIIFGLLSKCKFFQYFNIELYSIATHIVIALPTIATVGRVITIERLIRIKTAIKLRKEATKKSPI